MSIFLQHLRQKRRPKAYISSLTTNVIHSRNPWVAAWWSAAFPGFGQILLGSYFEGFLLIVWEIILNLSAKINQAILYSFTGHFELAKKTLDFKMVLLYISVYLYGIWSSYRTAVDMNKLSLLADREKSPIQTVKMSSMDINFLDKRNPWAAMAWSFLTPGLGHLYTHRLISGFFVLVWWITISYFTHLSALMQLSFTGHFADAIKMSHPQWLLFLPSIYSFAVYGSYVNAVEYNKLFEREQACFLRKNYQNIRFKMPV